VSELGSRGSAADPRWPEPWSLNGLGRFRGASSKSSGTPAKETTGAPERQSPESFNFCIEVSIHLSRIFTWR
jgi:hypothetical protein